MMSPSFSRNAADMLRSKRTGHPKATPEKNIRKHGFIGFVTPITRSDKLSVDEQHSNASRNWQF
jgi:hypothetical protein